MTADEDGHPAQKRLYEALTAQATNLKADDVQFSSKFIAGHGVFHNLIAGSNSTVVDHPLTGFS
jgi:hypothetical protein